MTRRATTRRERQPAGAWRRFFAAFAALVVVLVGVPALLLACTRAGLEEWHPIPAIGSSDEVKGFFQRDLTPTETAPIAMRVLLLVGWALWLGLATSVLGAIFEARGSALRSWVPQFALFAGLSRWIAAGLTAVTSIAPNFVSAGSLASPRPFTISSITPEQHAGAVEAPVPQGFGRVQRGESVETFAERLLGDAGRWPEIWELNRDQAVGPDGEPWVVPWKLGVGWNLRLPAGAVPVVAAAAPTVSARAPSTPVASAWSRRENLTVVDEYEVIDGDSFWEIAERFLPDGSTEEDVWELTQALMEVNGPRLGYAHPAMINPGDIVEIVALGASSPPPADIGEAAGSEIETVVAGDSYWEIAEEALGDGATQHDVLELTEDLIDLNSPRLAYDNPWMLHPGDVVYLAEPAAAAPSPLPPPAASVVADAIAIDVLPPPTSPPPPATVTTMQPATTTTSTTSTPSTTLPPPTLPSPAADAEAGADDGSPSSPIGIGQAALIATGLVALLAARRQARLRAAEPPARVPLPRPDAAATERTLRRLDASERLLRVDIVLRAAAAELADGDQRVVVVRSSPDGTIELDLTAPARLSEPWCGSERRWTMPGTVPVDDLAARARSVGAPCVALVQIGVDGDDWDVLVDLEAMGVLAVDAEQSAADQIVRALAVGLASSEFAEVAHLVGVGVDQGAFLGHRHAQVVPTVDEAIELAATLIGTTAASTRTTFSMRSHHTSGEMWEPAVILVATRHAAELSSGSGALVSTRGGLAIVVGAPLERAAWTLRPDGADLWSLEPLGLRLRPLGLQPDDVENLVDLFTETIEADVENVPADEASDVETVVVSADGNGHNNGHPLGGAATLLRAQPSTVDVAEYRDPPWSLMVRLLGQVEVVDNELRAAKFERSKTLELVSWLVTHRVRAARFAARTALWDLDVRDATFANVVSEARRAMARHVAPPDGDEWLRRTMTDELSLHDEVIADADIVRARYERARTTGGIEAMELLRPAVELVNELPFAGTGYLWPDAEGITSNLVLLATNVTTAYGKLALAAGDVDGVFWATGRGLQVLAGQEALIALRMRAHACSGDLAGVRMEWESYERVVNADPWSDGEPAAQLVALRTELLST
jgi:nucleoid-associated protein YgaU